MSSSEGDEQGTEDKFEGKFGAKPLISHPIAEASHEDVDAFIRQILGLAKDRETDSTTTKF